MRENVHKDVYRFAYDEASTELRKILRSFEQLCAQKNRVEKLMEVLKPEIGLQEEDESGTGEENDPPALLHGCYPPYGSVESRPTQPGIPR